MGQKACNAMLAMFGSLTTWVDAEKRESRSASVAGRDCSSPAVYKRRSTLAVPGPPSQAPTSLPRLNWTASQVTRRQDVLIPWPSTVQGRAGQGTAQRPLPGEQRCPSWRAVRLPAWHTSPHSQCWCWFQRACSGSELFAL